MPYLNLDLDYFDHPKARRLVGLLGRGAAELPIRLWCYCGKYHVESGSLASYSAQEIESIAGWWGKQGEMVEAMLKVGLLDKNETGYSIHEWEEHEGHLVSFHARAKLGAKARWEKIRNASSSAKEESKQCPIPNHTIPNQELKPPNPLWGFEEFWRAYPKRKARKKAEDSWRKLCPGAELREKIALSIKAQMKTEQWTKNAGEFIPHPATWLNQRRWEDEMQAAIQPRSPQSDAIAMGEIWRKAGRSYCHGSAVNDIDGIRRCASCNGEQK